jgi:Fe-S cluster biosynthesis and repair protein YggX
MIDCTRCGKSGGPAPAARIAFMGKLKERVAAGICADCWKEWETVEVKVINEYRLNFMDAEHREVLKRACSEFLGLDPGAAPRSPDLPLIQSK